jgi:NAD(P)-dependent dehydrogenase (short-subunit alcohol dehydrogenase family)
MTLSLSEKTIIVTGGSKGIGFATARSLLERGANVAIFARDQAGLDIAKQKLASDRCLAVAVDVTQNEAVKRAFKKVVDVFGGLQGVVNNVGHQFARRIEMVSEDEMQRLMALNFFSVVLCCQAAIPLLRENAGGRIVNISSASVRNPNEFSHLSMYSSAKAAMDQFTSELRHEVKADNIAVTLLSPGAVNTGSVENFDPQATLDAMKDWLKKGEEFDGAMEPSVVGQAVAQCFEFPYNVAVEFLEIRPNGVVPKTLESEWQ